MQNNFYDKLYNMNSREILEKFSEDKVHAKEVERLSLMIFDEVTQKIKELDNHHKQYLETAALLHDIGYYKKESGHNKHSQQMILEYGLDGFNELEKEIISCIARYHKGGLPDKRSHDVYCNLDKKERKIVKRLGGILKLADGLDADHKKLVKNVELNYNEEYNIAEIIITPNNFDYLPNLTPAIRKRDLFEIGFKTQTIIKFKSNYAL